MANYIGPTGLNYLWGKMKSLLAGGTSKKAQSIPFGDVDSTSVATAFTATVNGITALEDGVCCYLKNTVVTSAAATSNPKCWTLNINSLGAKPVYVTTAAATYSTTHFTKNYKMLFTYDSSLNSGSGGWYIGQLFNTNTTYSDMTQAEIDAGTGTTGRKITPKMLRDNFYTEDEVDGLLDNKQSTIDDLADIRSGAALGATALQSYTETDPTVPSWAKASTKPSYTASEVGAVPTTRTVNGKALNADITLSAADVSALPSSTVIPAAQVNSDWNVSSGVAQILNKPTLATVATSGSYNDLLNTPKYLPCSLAEYNAMASHESGIYYVIIDTTLEDNPIRKIMLGNTRVWPDVPYDAEIEYLESSGTQYIDTLYAFIDNYGFEIEFQGLGIDECVLGARKSSYRTGLVVGRDGAFCVNLGSHASANTPFNISTDMSARHKLRVMVNAQKASIFLDGVQKYQNYSFSGTYISGTSETLFGDNYGSGSIQEKASCKVYSLKLFQFNIPVIDFIPVRVGQVGYMYDRVSGILFGNSGTGSFTLGPDKI